MEHRDHTDDQLDGACSVEPDLGVSSREVYVGYGSWARARAVIQSSRRVASAGAGPERPAAPWRAPRRG